MTRFILHPLLLSIFPVWHLFVRNFKYISAHEIWLPVGISICLALLSFSCAKLLVKDPAKAGLLATHWVVLFYGYGLMQSLETPWTKNRYLLPAAVLLAWGGYRLIKNFANREIIINGNHYLNFLSVVVFVFPLANFARHHSFQEGQTKVLSTDIPGYRPDIYYIILDERPGTGMLKSVFGFDDSDHNKKLSEEGFFVAESAAANYPITSLSLTSIFNMDYLQNIFNTDTAGTGMKVEQVLSKLDHSLLVNQLKLWGYKYYHIGTRYERSLEMESADVNFNGKSLAQKEFILLYIESTFLRLPYYNWHRLFGRQSAVYTRAKRIQNVINFGFDAVTRVVEENGPKFVLAHILAPHHPYVFDKHGEIPENILNGNLCDFGNRCDPKYYLDQIQYVNKQVERVVQDILNRSKEEPVIIIHSDHGSFYRLSRLEDQKYWEGATIPMMQERLSMYFALYLPSRDYSLFYDTFSAVNTWPAIFNTVFHKEAPLMENVSYFTGYDGPLKFVKVPMGSESEGD